MAKIRVRKNNGNLFFDFQFKGKRCREQTTLPNTVANRKRLEKILVRLEAEITLGTFEYQKFFPNSPMAKKIENNFHICSSSSTPTFSDFSKQWMSEMKIQWRETHYDTNLGILNQYLFPKFGNKEVCSISKMEILEFRSSLATIKGAKIRNIVCI